MAVFQRLGPLEIALILAILLLLFGAKRLPEIGRSMGKSIREFRGATKGLADDVNEGLEDDEAEPASKAKAKDAAD
ncbi:MAG: twin-arginine translocase TatA/TatE family subunit [Actinomycetota bacterium]